MNPQTLYLCEKKENFTELEDGCGQWQQKTEQCGFSSARLQQAEEDIKAMIKILK